MGTKTTRNRRKWKQLGDWTVRFMLPDEAFEQVDIINSWAVDYENHGRRSQDWRILACRYTWVERTVNWYIEHIIEWESFCWAPCDTSGGKCYWPVKSMSTRILAIFLLHNLLVCGVVYWCGPQSTIIRLGQIGTGSNKMAVWRWRPGPFWIAEPA